MERSLMLNKEKAAILYHALAMYHHQLNKMMSGDVWDSVSTPLERPGNSVQALLYEVNRINGELAEG